MRILITIWRGIKCLLIAVGKGIKSIIEIIAEKPVVIGFLLLFFFGCLVIGSVYLRGKSYKGGFLDNIVVEAHGLLFDIFVFGILIIIFNKIGERKREIRRYREGIDDFRYWYSEEAMFRIVGYIKRLNQNGITKIQLHGCYLKGAILKEVKLRGADLEDVNLQNALINYADIQEGKICGANLSKAALWETNFQAADFTSAILQEANLASANLQDAILNDANLKEVDLRGADCKNASFEKADLRGAFLWDTNLQDAILGDANLQGAGLQEANLQGAKQLTVEQLSEVETLYGAKLDPELEKKIKQKYPLLLEEPKEED